MSVNKRLELHQIAEGQDGFFTAKQAADVGYDMGNFHHHVKSGDWIKEGHGLYRLAAFPWSPRQELWKTYMWSRNRQNEPQGVLSFQTALDLYDLSDSLPNEIHMTVPNDFRRRSNRPAPLRLHFEDLPATAVRRTHGLPCTTPIKTVTDLMNSGFSDALIKQAVQEGLQRGLITANDIAQYDSEPALVKKLRAFINA